MQTRQPLTSQWRRGIGARRMQNSNMISHVSDGSSWQPWCIVTGEAGTHGVSVTGQAGMLQ